MIITQCSIDRFDNLESLSRLWGGTVSAAVYVPTTSSAIKLSVLNKVHELILRLDKDASYTGQLVISVLFGHEDAPWRWSCKHEAAVGFPLYPINALRNLAIAAAGTRHQPGAAHTPLYFLLDVDFMPSPGLRKWLEQNAKNATFMARINAGSMIVVPAFETRLSVKKPTLPAVLDGLRKSTVQVFHGKRFPPGHMATNTPR
jgi:glycosyltransferase-like protein LARGE